ncbi:MAG: Hint domain-containing protein [Rhodobacteraceae bacterium]|nr:Hint domain-containing protein [Paracoccaceae bacterium]
MQQTVSARVHPAAAIRVTWGANTGDAIGTCEAVCPGDVYQLSPAADGLRLLLQPGPGGSGQRIAPGSARGRPGETVALEARHRLMTPEGDHVDLVILRLGTGGVGDDTAHFALPLGPLAPGIDYTLISSEAEVRAVRLADVLCISFAAGTLITLADGRQAAIESLVPGQRVLTRDHGAQPLRWIGKATLKAVGALAPVVVAAGALGNSRDLILSPHHRLFLYRRDRLAGRTTAEVLVQAKHLVDGERVYRRSGGYVDYHSLVFDRHEIVYAEGIPAESLMVTEATLAALPDGIAEEVRARFPGLCHHQHFGTEAGRDLLDAVGRDGLLRPPAA